MRGVESPVGIVLTNKKKLQKENWEIATTDITHFRIMNKRQCIMFH